MTPPPDQDTGTDGGIADRVRALRLERGLTLDALAERAAVSRAMLSRIERGESSPTAHLLGRICGGLGITLATLFTADRAADPLTRRAAQPVWRDPASGYVRRAVSSPFDGHSTAIVDVLLPAGAGVAFDAMGLTGVEQVVWLLDGVLEVTVGDAHHRLEAGDCLAMRLALPVRFAAAGRHACRYAVVTSRGGPNR